MPSAATIPSDTALDLNDRRIAFLSPIERNVLAKFVAAGGAGMTDAQVAAAMPGYLASSLTKVRLALRVARLIEATNQRRATGHGSATAVVYRASL